MTGVHLVGSVGLDTVPEVFAVAGKYLGPYLKRVPDGEVGGRRLWVSWQYPLLRASPFLQAVIIEAKRRCGVAGTMCTALGILDTTVRVIDRPL